MIAKTEFSLTGPSSICTLASDMPWTRRLRWDEITFCISRDITNNKHSSSLHLWTTGLDEGHCSSPSRLEIICSMSCDRRGNWLRGFNVCVPITIDDWNEKRVLVRFSIPYRVGEAVIPDNRDGKIRCEAGAYAQCQGNCPDAPIPSLCGFGLCTGKAV